MAILQQLELASEGGVVALNVRYRTFICTTSCKNCGKPLGIFYTSPPRPNLSVGLFVQ